MAFDPDAYLAKAGTAQKSFDPDAYLKNQEPPAEEKSTLDSIREALGKVRGVGPLSVAMNPAIQDLAARGLGYAGGIARTALATPSGAVSMADAVAALKGHAPTSSEYLEKAGVPEGPKVPLTNISARDVGGFAGDIATDPLIYFNPIAGLDAATGSEMNALTKNAGQNMYKSGLKRVDEEVAKYGKEPVSDLLRRERVTGSAKSIAEQMDKLAEDRLNKRDAILSKATKNGAITSSDKSLIGAEGFIEDMKAKNDPRLNPLIQKMQSEVDLLKTAQNATPEQMSAMKSNSYSVVGDQGYNDAKSTPFWKRFEKAVGKGQKEEVERAVGETLGASEKTALKQHNDELGRLLSSQERAEQDARIAGRKNAFTSVDAMIAGSQHGDGLLSYLSPMLLLKKAADISKESTFRTNGGLMLNDLGNTQIPAALYRREVSQNNPWETMK